MMELEHMFAMPIMKGEIKIMTENKTELIRLILENDNLEQAIMTASAIILDFLKQHESYEVQASVCLGVCGQMTPSS